MRCRSLLLLLLATMSSTALHAQDTDNEVTRLLESLDVLAPSYHGGLILFPLQLRGHGDRADYASLDEAFRGGYLRVSDTGSVERVTMQNTSRSRWVAALAGEVILGGKQNRMLREDVLLPPDDRPYTVPTYCVEKDRWTGHAKSAFRAGSSVGNYALRQKAMAGAPQAEVWGQVDEEQRRFRVAAPTKDFDAVMQSPAVARELSAYRKAFLPIWRPRIVGFVVARGGRIVAADAFGSARLFASLRHKLLDSYAFDCIGRHHGHRPSLGQAAARDFMAQVYAARFSRGSTPAAGSRLDFSGRTSGSALVHRGTVVHLHATQAGRPLPPPRPPRPPLPIPRPELR